MGCDVVHLDTRSLDYGDRILVEIDGKRRDATVIDTITDGRGFGIVIRTAPEGELIIGPQHVVDRA